MSIVRHVQRACGLMQELLATKEVATERRITAGINLTVATLWKDVLLPLYRAYPDLRGRDLRQVPDSDIPGATISKVQMGPATATYLRRVLLRAQTGLSEKLHDVDCGSREKQDCDRLTDIVAEIGFAGAPIYSSYPKLWQVELREGFRRGASQPRTPKTDAAFRASAPPRGSVQLTPAASAYLRDMLRSIRRQLDDECVVVAITWTLGMRSKGPNDAEWTTSGPGLSAGAFSCTQVPPDVIDTLDGIPIVFSGKDASQFAGKMIDRENGSLVLKERER
jgi:hypothetical protein